MAAAAVLCTKCGYHRESGVKFESHKTAGVDIDHGTLALQKAETDMFEAAEMQRKLASGPGLPWWGLALVLFVLGSGLVIATLAVNASRRVDATAPANPMALLPHPHRRRLWLGLRRCLCDGNCRWFQTGSQRRI